MARGDTLKTLVSGAQVLSDIYSKNRALDLALLQIEATQQGAAADRALKERQIELSETDTFSPLMDTPSLPAELPTPKSVGNTKIISSI